MKSEVGKRIEILLAEQGMMQKELAKKIGMTPQGVYQLKRSKRLQYATIQKLSKAFGVPTEYFFSW